MLNTSYVACLAHVVLAGYLGVTLFRGAKTAARRRLARCLLGFALYSAIFAVVLYRHGGPSDVANMPLMIVILFSTADFFAYARWIAGGSKPDVAVAVPRWTVTALVVSVAAICLFGVSVALVAAPNPWVPLALLLVMFTLFAGILATCLRARARGVRGAGVLVLACVCVLVPIVFLLISRTVFPALSVAMRPTYYLLRELLFLSFSFLVFVSYLDHGHEPMSIEDRIVAGVLTATLVVGVAGSRLVELQIGKLAETPETAALVDASARWFLLVVTAAAALTIAFVPRLFRRSVFTPIARLTGALARLERGERTEVTIDHEDEIGRMTRSFNTMAKGLAEGRERLEAQVREVEILNEELRRQVQARSRQLSDVLARMAGPGAGLDTGAIVDGRYRVDGRLGAGGMGIVYAVTRVTDDRPLALKVMQQATGPEDGMRFAREAEIAAGLAHPHLVGVIDVGIHEGLAFLVMERIDGGSLDDARDRWGDVAWALPLLGQIAAGLVTLHEQGILHRDLKPANVLLATGPGGATTAKITDFGIARRDATSVLATTGGIVDDPSIDATAPVAALKTESGVVIGTLAYLAPELARGPDELSAACDVFAFGVLAFELLAGKGPFVAPVVLVGMPAGPPPPLPDQVPAAIAALVRACLEAAPAKRPSSTEIARALGE